MRETLFHDMVVEIYYLPSELCVVYGNFAAMMT